MPIQLRNKKAPSAQQTRDLLRQVELLFPNFSGDQDVRVCAAISVAQVLGVLGGWHAHHRGNDSLEKMLRMVYAMAFDTALKSEAALRDPDRLRRILEQREEQQ